MFKNLELKPLKLSSWRKIALGSWNSGGDPSVYGTVEFDATHLLEAQKNWADANGKKAPTVTAIVAKAISITLHTYPQINGMIRFGRIYNRKHVTLFLQTAVDELGQELSGVVIENAENKTLFEIVDELAARAKSIRENKDPSFKQAKGLFGSLPVFLVRPVLNFTSFCIYTLNLNLSFLGLPRDPFGSVMITSIGSLDMDEAHAPIVPYSRVPLLLAVGKIRKIPVVRDDKIVITSQFKIGITLDHRFIDGLYGSKMVKLLRKLIETKEGLRELGF